MKKFPVILALSVTVFLLLAGILLAIFWEALFHPEARMFNEFDGFEECTAENVESIYISANSKSIPFIADFTLEDPDSIGEVMAVLESFEYGIFDIPFTEMGVGYSYSGFDIRITMKNGEYVEFTTWGIVDKYGNKYALDMGENDYYDKEKNYYGNWTFQLFIRDIYRKYFG